MTIAKDFAAKASVAFVAAAMILSMIAPAAQAQSTEDLQTMINTLLAQIASLQSQVGVSSGAGSTSGASFCPYTWTRDLKVGATGADVMKLQQFLNSDADTRVGATGAGSAGMETETFGPATAAAVSKFQVKYRAETLTPNGLVNPTGYFGASSRAKANALCVTDANPTTPVDPTDPTDPTTPANPSDLSGEASLDEYTADDADDDTIEEGSTDAPVAVFTAQFADGDASISRMDVAFTAAGSANAWDAFDSISLWVDGEMVAEADASSRGDYLGDEDLGIIRFSGLDLVGMEDEDLEITVAATMQDNLDDAELTTWTVTTEAVRYFDADGVATTDDTLVDEETASFTLQTAGVDDEVIVKSSSNDPDATTLQVETDKKSAEYNVFAFDLDTKDSVNDITINEMILTVTVSSSTYNTLVNDAELVIDGTRVTDVTVTGGATTTATLTFNVDGDVVIDAQDRVEAQLMLKFNSLATGNEGVTVTASITGNDTNIDAEGTDTLSGTNVSGAATGETHTLRTQGVTAELDTVSAVVTTVDSADDYATYKIAVDVTAFEQDVFFSTNPSTSTSWSLVDGSGATATTGSRSVTLESTGDEEAGYFEVLEGETETITLTVTYTPGVDNTAARLQLGSLLFRDAAGAPTQTWTASPTTTYRTAVVTIVN